MPLKIDFYGSDEEQILNVKESKEFNNMTPTEKELYIRTEVVTIEDVKKVLIALTAKSVN